MIVDRQASRQYGMIAGYWLQVIGCRLLGAGYWLWGMK
tara:strand:+ start:206 stop:319 length:114 start_codon:yes stop_codon:yes gene_type:complete